MPRPVIGVTTSVARGHIMWRGIRLGIWLAGGKARRLTASSHDDYESCNAYVIAGGADLNPALYGQENISSHAIEPERDTLEQAVITHALAAPKPLMGICRGAQMINVMLGGTLHQEVSEVYKDFMPTNSLIGKAFGRRAVQIIHQGIVNRIFKRPNLFVNSIHHQSIAQLGRGLIVSVVDKHGVTQAIECDNKGNILGVQWHPELMLYRKNQRLLFRWLVEQI